MLHDDRLLARFLVPTKRERYEEMISKPKKRAKFIRELDHFKSLDPRYQVSIPPSQQHPEQLAALLSQKGAPTSCCVTSSISEIDGKELPLLEVLKKVVGCQMGTFLSCIPGKLAYFEGEGKGDRWILERRDGPLTAGH
jgi:hypothetical protein